MESPPYNKQTPDQKDHVYDNIRNGKKVLDRNPARAIGDDSSTEIIS